jgi:Protein of unknown function (DUF3667)
MTMPPDAHHEQTAAPRICTNCGSPNVSTYCADCGEQQPGHHDYALLHFAGHAVHELVHVDSKLLTTLRLLVTKPGMLTAEYFAGRRSRYVSPLRILLILFAIYILLYMSSNWTSPISSRRLEKLDKQHAIGRLFDKIAAKKHLTHEQVEEQLDEQWKHAISAMQLATSIVLAAGMRLLWRRRYFVEHLVFAMHFLSFQFLLAILLWPLYWRYGIDRVGEHQFFQLVGVYVPATLYLYFGIRRYYGDPPVRAAFKTVGTVVAYFISSLVLVLVPWSYAVFRVLKKS